MLVILDNLASIRNKNKLLQIQKLRKTTIHADCTQKNV